MKYFSYPEIASRLYTYGRTWLDTQEQVLYSDYTCGGFEMEFTGSFLAVKFRAEPDTFVPPMVKLPEGTPPREDWPFVAAFLDDFREPVKKIRVHDGEMIPVFFSETAQTHRIRIIKLTENFRTAVGLAGILTDGELMPFVPEKKLVIEFIGDSITCGFGNDTRDVNHEFEAAEEDGWMTHGAIAARELNLEPRFICVSGISTENPVPMPGFYSMRDLYPYRDRIMEEKLAKRRGISASEPEKYDFTEKPARYVVLNLGTNDATQISMREDKTQALEDFRKNYRQFVQEIRAMNGQETVILCALGCMDYYLYDEICNIANSLQAENGDKRIFTLKYERMMNMGPDVGGCLHPSIYRHQRMARDLVDKIRILQEMGL